MNRSTPIVLRGCQLWNKAGVFLTAPASPRPLAIFRIGLAAVLLCQAFSLAQHVFDLYGNRGLVQWSIADRLAAGVPRLSWLAETLAPAGIEDADCVRAVFLVYVVSLACLLVGWSTRWASLGAWLTHWLLNVSGTASTYGVDQFAHIALFYCLWMPVGNTLSADQRGGRVQEGPSSLARLSLRVLQIHLVIVYLASGLEKASGEQWRNGEAIWRALMRPDLNQFDVTWLAHFPWMAKALCWSTLVVELGYAFFVWPRRTRRLWALATMGLHGGIAVGLGLWSFSAVMMVLNLAAFVVEEETGTAVGPLSARAINGRCPQLG